MRVDMRPKVVAKIMSKEIFLFVFALIAAAGMPIYFYKVHGAREIMAEKEYEKIIEKQEQEDEMRRDSDFSRHILVLLSRLISLGKQTIS